MYKCSQCNKTIKNVFYLDGKQYGYSCYRKALITKKAELKELKYSIYNLECVALIEVFKTIQFKKQYNIRFQNGIVNFWNKVNKLTYKQQQMIKSNFSKKNHIDFLLLYFELLDDENKKHEISKAVFNNVVSSNDIAIKKLMIDYVNNVDVMNIFKYWRRDSKRLIDYVYINYIDLDYNKECCTIRRSRNIDINEFREDERKDYIRIINIIEFEI